MKISYCVLLTLYGISALAQKGPDFTVPLKKDGSDYPCRGLENTLFNSTMSMDAGTVFTISTEGNRPPGSYGGGSCQLALSYDDGQLFRVIKSMIGSCPDISAFAFSIPQDAPAGGVLVAWTWFNRRGFPEMYMLCERMAISNRTLTSAPSSPTPTQTDVEGHDAHFYQLPGMFIANIDHEDNHGRRCRTIQGEEVVFPQPGPDVQYGETVLESGKKGYYCSNPSSSSSSSSSPSSSSSRTSTSPAETSSSAARRRGLFLWS